MSGLEVVAFGTNSPSSNVKLPKNFEFFKRPVQEALKDIYFSTYAWILSSRREGFCLPIIEAMACGTPVISNAAGATPGIISPEEGRLCSVDDVEAITQAIIELCSMSNAKWKSLSGASLRKASLHSWSKATDKFERALEQLQ